MYWVSKVVGGTVGAAERIADIQHEWHIAEKQLQIEQVLSKLSPCYPPVRWV